MTSFTQYQLQKAARRRSEEFAKGKLEDDLPREYTIEYLCEHYQMSRDQVLEQLGPPAHEQRHG